MGDSIIVSARYFIRVDNFGDRITPFLIDRIAHRIPALSSVDAPHLLGCGSILEGANENSIVWGSGFIRKDSRCPKLSEGNVRAVRGTLSLNKLKEHYSWLRDPPLGDPGSLLPREYSRRKDPIYPFGVIPHYIDKEHPFLNYCRSQGGLVIDVQRDVTDVLDELFLCERILSSSLHGLIVSDAYGIANRWIKLSEGVVGQGFKFHDYYSTRTETQGSPSVINAYPSIRELLDFCVITKAKNDLSKLYDSFPIDEACTKTAAQIIDCSTLKRRSNQPTPIFVELKNSLSGLKNLLRAIAATDDDVKFVIHDLGSKNSDYLELLESIDDERVVVYNASSLTNSIANSSSLSNTIEHYFSRYSEPLQYGIADIELLDRNSLVASLAVAHNLLMRHHNADSVRFACNFRWIPRKLDYKNWFRKIRHLVFSRRTIQTYNQGGVEARYTRKVDLNWSLVFFRAGFANHNSNKSPRPALVVVSLYKKRVP